jgi:hypothetical protein
LAAITHRSLKKHFVKHEIAYIFVKLNRIVKSKLHASIGGRLFQ